MKVIDEIRNPGVDQTRAFFDPKALGVFAVPVRLHADVKPEVKVWVIKEE